MANKIFLANGELQILRTLTDAPNARVAGKIFAALDKDCFYTATSKELYARIVKYSRDKARLPDWDDLKEDLKLTQTTRDRISIFKKKPLRSKESVSRLIDRIQEYRRTRILYYAGRHIAKSLDGETINSAELLEETTEFITRARANSDTSRWMVNIGLKTDKSGEALLKRTLKVTSKSYVPTGYPSFDRRSMGIPTGSFMLIATVTGGGKTVQIGQLGEQMALNGAKVCIVPLEMSDIEMEQRQLSRLAEIPMTDILRAGELDKKTRRKIKKAYRVYASRVNKNGGQLTYFCPEEDFTMEEILMTLRPYGFKAIFIDYVGITKGTDGDDQARALGRVTRFGKRYAKINDTIVGVAAQLDSELGRVRYSRAMVEHANIAWVWDYGEAEKNSGLVKIRQPKSRNQEDFSFYLKPDFPYMRFISLTSKEEREIERDEQKRQTAEKDKGGDRKSERKDEKPAKQPKRDFQQTTKKVRFFN